MDISENKNVLCEFILPKEYIDKYNGLNNFETRIIHEAILQLVEVSKYTSEQVNEFVKACVITFIDKKTEHNLKIETIDDYIAFMALEQPETYSLDGY